MNSFKSTVLERIALLYLISFFFTSSYAILQNGHSSESENSNKATQPTTGIEGSENATPTESSSLKQKLTNVVTKIEGEEVKLSCVSTNKSPNLTIIWTRNGVPVSQLSSLESRIQQEKEYLIINPLVADDVGVFECRELNGVGQVQIGRPYALNVEYPAKVYYSPTIQYLPNDLAGVVRCFIIANPPVDFVLWTKDNELLEPHDADGTEVMAHGSLMIDRVNKTHEGNYTCTPHNFHGTLGASLEMAVVVKEPPIFEINPDPEYRVKLGSYVSIPCSAVDPNSTIAPLISWQRKDGKSRSPHTSVIEGNLTIDNFQEDDHGEYECVASNEVASIFASTQILIEGRKSIQTPPNATEKCALFTLTWSPEYSNETDIQQSYEVRYREEGDAIWNTVPLQCSNNGSTHVTEVKIVNVSPGKMYQFQIADKNANQMASNPSVIVNEIAEKDEAFVGKDAIKQEMFQFY